MGYHEHIKEDEFDLNTLEISALMFSIERLYKAMDLIVSVNNEIIENDVLNGLDLIEKLNNCWLEVNKCRIHTEKINFIEELLIPGLGLINDAKCMLESLIVWKLGMTEYGKHNIIKCLRIAALENINVALDDLEYLLGEKRNDKDELVNFEEF